VTIKSVKDYQTLAPITDSDVYFADMKSRLSQELKQLQHGDA